MRISRITALGTFTLLVAIAAAADEPAAPADTHWTRYNNHVNGQRSVDVNQITPANADKLGEICRLTVEKIGAFHTRLLEIDGGLYFTAATDTVAVDATHCKRRRRHHYTTEDHAGTPLAANRGVAYANG